MDFKLNLLSKREQQIAMKIIEGLPNKLIANELFISERTVKFHCANIYRKLNLLNRHMLIAWYFKGKYEASPMVAEPVKEFEHQC
jgi:DNA-binding CsgD family transcriptional regulator